MAAPATLHRHSYADYLALEDSSNTKHEFLNGEIYVDEIYLGFKP